MLKEVAQIRDVGVNCNLVLPLELGPHAAKVFALALCWANVIHYIELNVAQVYVSLLRSGAVVKDDGAKNMTGLGR
jgi:hypothetical protein